MPASRKQNYSLVTGSIISGSGFCLIYAPLYGERIELVRSLKTTAKKQAHSLASGLQQKYTVTLSLLRSDPLSPEVIQALVSDSRPRRESVRKHITADAPLPLPNSQ